MHCMIILKCLSRMGCEQYFTISCLNFVLNINTSTEFVMLCFKSALHEVRNRFKLKECFDQCFFYFNSVWCVFRENPSLQYKKVQWIHVCMEAKYMSKWKQECFSNPLLLNPNDSSFRHNAFFILLFIKWLDIIFSLSWFEKRTSFFWHFESILGSNACVAGRLSICLLQLFLVELFHDVFNNISFHIYFLSNK